MDLKIDSIIIEREQTNKEEMRCEVCTDYNRLAGVNRWKTLPVVGVVRRRSVVLVDFFRFAVVLVEGRRLASVVLVVEGF